MAKGWKKEVGAIVHSRGVTFRVWAPFADNVALTGSFNDWNPQDMTPEGDGYWYFYHRSALEGQEYKFLIKNGDKQLLKNDPRAMQLTTAAGNSVIVDPAFEWGEDNFVMPTREELVIYETHIGTFHRPDPATTGTFEDAISKLDHLVDLGINAIELMPIGTVNEKRSYWGYVTDYIYAVERLYGGHHHFLQFVKTAHEKGIGVIVDVVYNHLGPDENLDLWQFDGWHENSKGGIYFYNDWRSRTPWSDTRPDFGRAEVQQYFIDNVKMWLHDCKVDGLRVDSTIYIRNAHGDNNDPGADLPDGWKLLQNINSVAKKINPQSFIVAEDNSSNEYITKPIDNAGAGFDAQWEIGMPVVLRDALRANRIEEINLEGILSELARTYNGDAFERIIYSDSHDSAANGGARLNETVKPNHAQSPTALAKSLIATGIVMTAPGIPMLLQGQELATPGDFNDWQALDWQSADEFSGFIDAHRHLIALRKNSHGVSQGLKGQLTNISHVDEANKVIAYHRWDKGGPKDDVVVIANFAKRTHKEYVLGWPRNGTWRVRFNSSWKGYHEGFKGIDVPDVTVDSGSGSVALPPTSLLILSQDE